MQPNDKAVVVLASVLFITALLLLVLAFQLDSALQQTHDAAIERGYALYCPIDGKLAWAGECNDE